MIALQVAGTLLREVLRTLLTPLRLLTYLPFRHHWRRVAQEVLNELAEEPNDAEREIVATLRKRRQPTADPGGAPYKLFLSAGEASGETHAVALVQALNSQPIHFRAFGGSALQKAGADLLFPLSEHAAMGFFSVVSQLPMIVRAYATFLRMLRDDPPDLVVLVDYPGLHLVMAKACRRRGIPVLHYVAPQYWAWGPWRMRRYRRSVDATLTILPFETAFFRRFHVPARYVGHPLLDELERNTPDSTAIADVAARPTLCLLPGSRRAEISANLPGMLRAAAALRSEQPDLRVVLPHRDPRRTALLRQLLTEAKADFVEHHEGPLAPWLAGARLVLAKSGTGSLEACLHGNPVVVVYKLSNMISSIGYHNILSVPYIAAANLIAGRKVVPEFCFHGDGGWDEVTKAVHELWLDGPARTRCQQGLAEVRERLGSGGATRRVADIVQGFFAPNSAT
ncbi:MAG: lipid-A-disaccharide synthase [Planctomycetota bacterium]|nr:lipid-A-disaccharide synthase [Planctomycetota bacterium]